MKQKRMARCMKRKRKHLLRKHGNYTQRLDRKDGKEYKKRRRKRHCKRRMFSTEANKSWKKLKLKNGIQAGKRRNHFRWRNSVPFSRFRARKRMIGHDGLPDTSEAMKRNRKWKQRPKKKKRKKEKGRQESNQTRYGP